MVISLEKFLQSGKLGILKRLLITSLRLARFVSLLYSIYTDMAIYTSIFQNTALRSILIVLFRFLNEIIIETTLLISNFVSWNLVLSIKAHPVEYRCIEKIVHQLPLLRVFYIQTICVPDIVIFRLRLVKAHCTEVPVSSYVIPNFADVNDMHTSYFLKIFPTNIGIKFVDGKTCYSFA